MQKLTTPWIKMAAAIPGKNNPLPLYTRLQCPEPLIFDRNLATDDIRGKFPDLRLPILPYLIKDDYRRNRPVHSLPAVVLENNFLRACLLPEAGGRLVSLFDKKAGRELLFRNPVFQPANLAKRNAWFSGGIEWNGLTFGHAPHTADRVFMARVETPQGPVLRMYEFDRHREIAWQADLLLPENSRILFAHITLRNTQPHPVDVYWWTNIAAPLTPGMRVLSPGDAVVSHSPDNRIRRYPFPRYRGFEASYPGNFPFADSLFFRTKRPSQVPFVSCVDRRGKGMLQCSTFGLPGRKFFVWGNGPGGRHWMDFLSEPGRGGYLEIQAGITPTQLQNRRLAPGEILSWTEGFMPLSLVRTDAFGDYRKACASAEKQRANILPDSVMNKTHAFLCSCADLPPVKLLHIGSAWGGLHEAITGQRLGPGLPFPRIMNSESKPWFELLEKGTFSEGTLRSSPESFQVSAAWKKRLRLSCAHKATWLHHLHLGVISMEEGQFRKAGRHFLVSQKLKHSSEASRNLALLAKRKGNLNAAFANYERAWKLGVKKSALAVEICAFLAGSDREAALVLFLRSLPPAVRKHERIQMELAKLALAAGRFAEVRRILSREFATVREGETLLSDLWLMLHRKEEERRLGRLLTQRESAEVEKRFPVPAHLDFRMMAQSR